MFNLFKLRLLGLIQIFFLALTLNGIMSQAQATEDVSFSVAQATVQQISLDKFDIKWNAGFSSKYGGTATVHSLLVPDFQINVAGFDDAFSFPKKTIENWFTPVAGSGISFYSVTNDGAWGPDQNVYITSIGIGVDTSTNGNFDGDLVFLPGLAHWNITVTTPVPEPASYAMLLLGLLVLSWIVVRAPQEKKF